ncbi:amidase [Solihabitans fulvus]|uniref:Amidase n=1 Tax=Solihabitans fulvus TaxID=1892852 RepID=A0A5B2XS74_9PSEU|nr:amidase [Solihabitans fulvus]KAA2265721.1 amidase [Solihabitans fulvus]
MNLTDVCFAGAAAQAALLRSGELSSRELVAECLRRIERYDQDLNSFRLVFADQARQAAHEADERRARGEDAPLLGVPVAVKEDLAIGGLPTTTGTEGVTRVEPVDGEVVRRLRAAGAVIVGRTRMPELGLWPFTQSPFAGTTRNPWSSEHSAGGSSGGSAAAVSAGLVGAAIGTDGAGSIRIPSASTGVFGLKPQRGRISLHPKGEVWDGLVAAGPITRHVQDWALVADQLWGGLPGDPVTAQAPRTSFAEAAATEPGRLRVVVSLRPWGVGVPVHPEVRDAVLDTASLLTDLGHEVVRADPGMREAAGQLNFSARYLHAAAVSAAELDRPDRLSRRTRQTVAMGRLLPRSLAGAVLRAGAGFAQHANRIFGRFDLLLTPVLTQPPMRSAQWEGRATVPTLLAASRYTAFLHLWNVAGNPAASVPAGHTASGLPLAVQLVGRQHDECTVLSLAAQLERVRPWADRRPPGFD